VATVVRRSPDALPGERGLKTAARATATITINPSLNHTEQGPTGIRRSEDLNHSDEHVVPTRTPPCPGVVR
jgi:hypothetical protein